MASMNNRGKKCIFASLSFVVAFLAESLIYNDFFGPKSSSSGGLITWNSFLRNSLSPTQFASLVKKMNGNSSKLIFQQMVELGVLSSWIVFIFSQLHFFQAKLRLLPIYSAALVRHLVSKWAAACQLLFSIVMFFCHLASNRFILVMVKDGVSDSIFYHQSYMHTAFLLVSAIQTAHIAILHLAFASSSISRQKYSSKLTLITRLPFILGSPVLIAPTIMGACSLVMLLIGVLRIIPLASILPRLQFLSSLVVLFVFLNELEMLEWISFPKSKEQ